MKQNPFAATAFAIVVTAGILTASCTQPAQQPEAQSGQQPASQSAPAQDLADGPAAAAGIHARRWNDDPGGNDVDHLHEDEQDGRTHRGHAREPDRRR